MFFMFKTARENNHNDTIVSDVTSRAKKAMHGELKVDEF